MIVKIAEKIAEIDKRLEGNLGSGDDSMDMGERLKEVGDSLKSRVYNRTKELTDDDISGDSNVALEGIGDIPDHQLKDSNN